MGDSNNANPQKQSSNKNSHQEDTFISRISPFSLIKVFNKYQAEEDHCLSRIDKGSFLGCEVQSCSSCQPVKIAWFTRFQVAEDSPAARAS